MSLKHVQEIHISYLNKKFRAKLAVEIKIIKLHFYFLGAILSVVFFKKKSWPLIFGSGSGFFISFIRCKQAFDK